MVYPQRYAACYSYGKTDRAERYYAGRWTADYEVAKAAALAFASVPALFGHGLVVDWNLGGKVIYHTGRD